MEETSDTSMNEIVDEALEDEEIKEEDDAEEMEETIETPVNVGELLASHSEKESEASKSIEVFKEVEASIDNGNLLLVDNQPVDKATLKSNLSLFLNTLARDNAQLLFNSIWQLPIEKVDGNILAKLPDPTTLLPREKPIPKPKPPTKWEAYAAKKGIQNKKRGRMLWDEEAKAWKPRYGYKRTKDDTNEWCLEVPENSDPYEDQFEKRETAKKERVAKNELQRLRNIAKNQKGGKGMIMSTQFKPAEKKEKERLGQEVEIAKVSTASVGKFQDKLPKEKKMKNAGKKRKFESVAGDSSSEKKRALEIWGKVNKPDNTPNMEKAVNKKIASDQINAASNKKKGKSGSGKIKNKHYREGYAQKAAKKQTKMMKGKTLGKGKKNR